MSFSKQVLKKEESVTYSLRDLYRKYGYSLYKVSKFEEYDLYAHNKSFLVSQNVLTFTDTNGKLLALKPDVTLSIIKNIPDQDTVIHKLCYNENVYRTSAESNGFREIMQTGLECIGKIDLYAECEVIMLALRSLETVSKDYILDLSHMGIIDGLLEYTNIDPADREPFIRLIESKNTNSLAYICDQQGICEDIKKKLCTLADLYLPINQALPVLASLVLGEKMKQAYENLKNIGAVLSAYGLDNRLYLDFSIVNDATYYDGLSFRGFINGIPDSVLSGGRYDRLLHRLGKQSGAIGFAVYLDRLARFEAESESFDVDVMLWYDPDTKPQDLLVAQRRLLENGNRVITVSEPCESVRYRQLVKLTNGGMITLETND